MISTWLDSAAGRFHAAGGAANLPTAHDFHRAELEEIRVAARREFDMAHRPNDPPTVPITAMEAERAFAMRRDAIAMRANWVGTGTPEGDAEIRERCRRMIVGVEAERLASLARVTGPGEMSREQLAAFAQSEQALRGVPRGDW